MGSEKKSSLGCFGLRPYTWSTHHWHPPCSSHQLDSGRISRRPFLAAAATTRSRREKPSSEKTPSLGWKGRDIFDDS